MMRAPVALVDGRVRESERRLSDAPDLLVSPRVTSTLSAPRYGRPSSP